MYIGFNKGVKQTAVRNKSKRGNSKILVVNDDVGYHIKIYFMKLYYPI